MTPSASRASAPRFEIVSARDMPRPRSKRAGRLAFGALFGAIRMVVEDAYVSLAREVMIRTEQLEDTRAERSHAKRVRKTERLRRTRKHEPSRLHTGRAKTSSAPVS